MQKYILIDIWEMCHIYEGIFYRNRTQNFVAEGNILS